MISYFLHIALLKGDKCYHAISRDLSCRTHELLKLENGDVSFKTVGSSHAEVVVNGKTETRPKTKYRYFGLFILGTPPD